MRFQHEFMRYAYNLDPDALVFDVGGYKGEFAQTIYDKFKCWVYIFEPVLEFANNIEKKFEGNKKIKVFKFGLSDVTRKAQINVYADGTSLYGMQGIWFDAQFISVGDLLTMEGINRVDLLKLNIEGDEFPVLWHILNEGLQETFDNIQVQFHSFYPDAEKHRNEIHSVLRNTHELSWCFPFIWESWKIK